MRSSILRSLALVSLAVAPGCVYPYTPSDAGDGAWIEQVVPALLGRKPINAVESKVLADIARQKGREAVVDVLLSTPEVDGYWSIVIADMMKVQRSGSMPQDGNTTAAACWNTPSLYPTVGAGQSALAAALSTQMDPTQTASLPGNFTMADVLRSAIARDDLFAPWRAQLLSLGHHGRQQPDAAKTVFLDGFLKRKQECLGCHTSTHSTSAIAPIPMDLDGSLFPSPSPVTAADNLYHAFSETLGPTTLALGHTSCATILQTSHPDAYQPANPGDELAGLNPASTANYDVLDLDAALMAGRASLTASDVGGGFSKAYAPDHVFAHATAPLPGDKAFAAALALSTTEAVIKELEGHGLTLPHGHPRVDEQRYYLQGYAYTLVAANWSLRYLLKSLVLRGTFNMVAPNQAQGAYPFPMFFNGWAKNDTGASQNVNGQGDLVHRFSVPALLTAVQHGLGWSRPKISPSPLSPVTPAFASKDFHRDLGRHESLAQPAKDDVDFQGLLAWEETVGMCQKPMASGMSAYSDWVNLVVTAVNTPGAPGYTLRDVVVAFKDRFVQDQSIGEDFITADPPLDPVPDPGLEKSVPGGGHDMNWDDPESVVDRTNLESGSSALRAKQRDAAGQVAGKFAAQQAYAEANAPVDTTDPSAGWRERYDAYTEKLGDPEWKAQWIAKRDTLDERSAAKQLDAYGHQKGYWKNHFPASEADLLASYFGVSSLGFPAAQIANLESKLRGYCGTLLTSPQFMLGGMRPAQVAADPVPALLVCLPAQSAYCNEHQLCTQYAAYAAAHGYGSVTCP
ncbi:MAG: hypothetical protein QM820_14430 [Minicystis sp.]